MKNEYSHSDECLRNKVEGAEMTPPANAWTGIEQGLSATSRGRRKGFFFFSTILIVLLIGSSTAAFFILQSPSGTERFGSLSISENATINQIPVEPNRANHKYNPANAETNSANQENNIEQTTNASGADDHLRQNDKKLNSIGNQLEHAQESAGAKNNLEDKANKVQAKTSQKESTSKNSTTTELKSANTNNTANQNSNSNESTKGTTNQNSNGKTNKNGTLNATALSDSGPSKEKNEAIAAASKLSSDLKQTTFLQPNPLTQLTTNGNGGLVSIAHKPMPYKKAAWSAEAGFGISQFQYKATSGSASFQQGIKDAQSGEQGMEAFALVNYQFNRYLTAYTGLHYSQEKNALDYITTSTSSELTLDTVGWYVDSVTQVQTPVLDSTYTTTTSNQNYQVLNQANYLTIPIGVMFSFSVGVRSELGIRASALIGFRTKSQGVVLTDLNGTTVDMNYAYLKLGILTFNAAFRYSFALNEKNKIYVEPWIGFGLNNRSTAALPYYSRFTASGVRIGFRRQF
jgi:hypothetical protein